MPEKGLAAQYRTILQRFFFKAFLASRRTEAGRKKYVDGQADELYRQRLAADDAFKSYIFDKA